MTETFLKYRKYILLLLVSAVFLGLSFLKSGFYVDEIYSYGHSNSSVGAYFEKYFYNKSQASYKDEFHHQWLDGVLFHRWLTVQENERFDYANIGENLKQSVHPPLFYYLLHTVCSFVPEGFHKAMGLGLNFIILGLLFYWFYRLAEKVFSDENKALAVTAFFMFAPLVLEMQIYIRMYLLEMALMTGLWWQTMLFLDDEKIAYKRLLFIFGLAVLCFLTHYYALIAVFFLTATVCTVFMIQKKYRKSLVFGASILLSLAAAFLIFRQAYQVLFFSDRGMETKEVAVHFNLQVMLDAASFFWVQICRSATGLSNVWAWIILPFVLAFLIFAKIGLKGKIFLCAGVLSGVVIAIVAPNMGNFNGRYYAGILVPLFLVLAIAVNHLFGKYLSGKIVFAIWLLFFSFEVYQVNASPYLERDSEVSKICEITDGKEVVLQRQLFMSIFQLASCWQNAKKIYVIAANERPDDILDEASAGTVFIQEVGQGHKKYQSHALYAQDSKFGLSYIGMYKADKILYDIYVKKDGAF